MNKLEMAGQVDVKKIREQAEQGDAEAQLILGDANYSGDICDGGYPNYFEAASWYRKAAEQGHAKAMYQLGTMYYLGMMRRKKGEPNSYRQAADWFHEIAKQMLSTGLNDCCAGSNGRQNRLYPNSTSRSDT